MFRKMIPRRMWLLITIACVAAFWVTPAAAYQLEVEVWIDGYSQLIIQGNKVQWHNLSWTVPGWEPPDSQSPPPQFPTKLTTVDMGLVQWQPTWTPGIAPGDDKPTGNQWSDVFTGLNLPLAAMAQTVSISFMGRDNVFISQQPDAGNGYTLIVDFDDYYTGGAAWYTAWLTYTPGAPPAPLPGTAVLLGSGLLSLLAWRRSRNI